MTTRKQIALSDEIWQRVEDYRRCQTNIPTEAAALRELICIGLDAFLEAEEEGG